MNGDLDFIPRSKICHCQYLCKYFKFRVILQTNQEEKVNSIDIIVRTLWPRCSSSSDLRKTVRKANLLGNILWTQGHSKPGSWLELYLGLSRWKDRVLLGFKLLKSHLWAHALLTYFFRYQYILDYTMLQKIKMYISIFKGIDCKWPFKKNVNFRFRTILCT